MQPGIGNDLFEIYKGFKSSKAEAEQKNRLMEIGGLAGSGDYRGAASKALAYGDLQTGNSLLQLAQGQKKEAQLDKDRLAGALFAAKNDPRKWAQVTQYAQSHGIELLPEEADFNTGPTLLMQHLTPEGQLKQQNDDREFNANEAYRGANLAIEREKLAGTGAKPPAGYRYTADGNLEFIKGGPSDPNKPVPARAFRPTTDQTNAAGFYDRMAEAEKTLSDPAVITAATDYTGRVKANLPFGAGNYLASPEYQKFDQAQRNFINAVLRKESGAAISQGEFDNAAIQYFPQPGDTADKIALKAQNRATAIHSMKRAASSVLNQDQSQQQQQGAAEMPTGDAEAAFADAQEAISQGADPQAVAQELIGMGIDPQMVEQALQQ